MVVTVVYQIKKRKKTGYETHIGRTLKIIWGVFNLAWILLVYISILKEQNPVDSILFLLGSHDPYHGALNSIQTLFNWRDSRHYLQYCMRLQSKWILAVNKWYRLRFRVTCSWNYPLL